VSAASGAELPLHGGRHTQNCDVRLNEVHEGDCIELLRELPDECAQLVIADPPYNIGPRFGGAKEWQHDDAWDAWCAAWLAECQRVLAPDGNLFVYGIHHYLCFVQVRCYELGLRYRRQIIWHYENGFTTYRRSLATHYEPLLWVSKTDDYFFDEIREPYKSTDRLRHKIVKNGKVWTPHPDGRLAGDVWRFPTLAGRRFRDEKVDHPTQKPLALTDRIVTHFSELGRLVVVPFGGSGTECVSAANNGRDYWACEINPDYVALATERVRRTGSIALT
jgi:DNA modification methylase